MNAITKVMQAAAATTTTDEHGVVRGICLMCATPVPLTPGGAIGRHSVNPEKMGNHAKYTYAQSLAAQQWLREAKWDMLREYTDGVPGDAFAEMLFGI